MSIRDEYESLDALALAERVRSGDVKPTELLEVAIERAEKFGKLMTIALATINETKKELIANTMILYASNSRRLNGPANKKSISLGEK